MNVQHLCERKRAIATWSLLLTNNHKSRKYTERNDPSPNILIDVIAYWGYLTEVPFDLLRRYNISLNTSPHGKRAFTAPFGTTRSIATITTLC